jgi:DNA-directed RNA polymerase subunit RPC12/RpoP
MRKIHKETIGDKVHRYHYDTKVIKKNCVDCGFSIRGDLEQNYIKHGNYCQQCNSKYMGSFKKVTGKRT